MLGRYFFYIGLERDLKEWSPFGRDNLHCGVTLIASMRGFLRDF